MSAMSGGKEAGPPRKHHFLPEFYLRQWVGSDEKFERFSMEQGGLHRRRAHPSQTAFQTDLYRVPSATLDEWEAQSLETKFFSPIDNAASAVLREMVELGRVPSTSESRTAWMTFLMSLLHRTPEHLFATLDAIRQANEDLMPEVEQRYAQIKGPNDPPTFKEWELQRLPDAVLHSGYRALTDVIASPRQGTYLINLQWRVLDVSKADHKLMTSDNPTILVPLKQPEGHLALPVSPTKLFIAAEHEHVVLSLARAHPKQIVRVVNRLIVERATKYVIATDDRQERFIRKYFGTCRIGSLATGFRQPARLI